MAYILIDIGGSKIRVGVARSNSTVDDWESHATPTDFATGIKLIIDTAQKLIKKQMATGIVVGAPGPLNANKSQIIGAANLPDWNNKPLKQILEEALKTPAQLENDAALAGLGEAMYGAGRGKNIVAYITVSTGIGGARIVQGKIDQSAFGFEPGHQIIVMDGEVCGCGARGHLEAYASGTGIEKRYGKPAETIDDPKIWREITNYLAVGLQNIIVHWSPDAVILGGSVSQKIDLDELQAGILNLHPVFKPLPPTIKSTLGETSGLYGALAAVTHD